MPSRLYAVGVGPGDPELLTRKAERILRSVPVIYSPTGAADAASYALSIIEPFLDRTRQEVLTRLFPMTKDESELVPLWEETAAEVAQRVREGQDVAFITIGDPLLYSTFLYLYRIFRDKYPEIDVEIVPGITSVGAAAAAAGVSLGLSADRLAILPATYEEQQLRQTCFAQCKDASQRFLQLVFCLNLFVDVIGRYCHSCISSLDYRFQRFLFMTGITFYSFHQIGNKIIASF
jgi:precorrin-2/cobalt-factor-2 C20-methyltransferase